MENLSRNRLFPFHSVRCLKSFAKQDVHHCFDSIYSLYKWLPSIYSQYAMLGMILPNS